MFMPLAQSTSEGGFSVPLGGVVILVLMVITALLIRNMAGRLKRLPDSYTPSTSASEPHRAGEEASAQP